MTGRLHAPNSPVYGGSHGNQDGRELPPRVPVVVVGAGPSGLCLAAELALAKVDCVVLERQPRRAAETRAMVLHSRTLEYFDMRGSVRGFVDEGFRYDRYPIGSPRADVDLTRLPSRHACALAVPQFRTEAFLEARALSAGVPVAYGAEVSDIVPSAGCAVVAVKHGVNVRHITADYVVGCDGAHSTVRQRAGIAFPGTRYSSYVLSADVFLTSPPRPGPWASFSRVGMIILLPAGGDMWRVIVYDYRDRSDRPGDSLTQDVVRSLMRRICGTDFGWRGAERFSRYRCERHQVEEYRRGRVLLAGDAAHIHPPTGGKGLNTGIADAMNLGWKLGRVLKTSAPDGLLDSYQEERGADATRVLRFTDVLLRFNTARGLAWRGLRRLALEAVLPARPAQRFLADALSGLGTTYRRPRERPPTGDRIPDMEVWDGSGSTRLFKTLRSGKFVLLSCRDRPSRLLPDPSATSSVIMVRSEQAGSMAGTEVLVRPDGYIAWSGRAPNPSLTAAMARWGAETPMSTRERGSR
ncbi:FAD-dependent monooxygenase [Streptomyces chengmaiensis]|uniref:FAD-dependent monooxygenase n=1 Tax=Streptomyces chengmaiensis TaxID=3040919 RepID=UPI0029620503|nr:FAD-dependent monooxygenase [Streptomyces chengmaiensis]